MTVSQKASTGSSEIKQEAVCEFLTSPEAFPVEHTDEQDVTVISTHCAHLFIYGDTVYKIKRAVVYSYLDMGTLKKRKKLCDRELEINQKHLPDVYLNVVPVTREINGQLMIDGEGEAVEWVIVMRRFDEADVLDNIALEGKLDNALAKAMGKSIAEYHHSLMDAPLHDGYDRMKEVIDELNEEFSLLTAYLNVDKLERFNVEGNRALAASKKLLDDRGNQGYIRRCHGDLHLRNIVLKDSTPVPFDALEFNERMATIDTLYDLAFLLMDLDHRGLGEQKLLVFNEYLLHSQLYDFNSLSLMPLFLFCRAGIKAMTSTQAAVHQNPSNALEMNEAEDYLDLALSYLEPHKPMLIAVGGVSGTGKSTAATGIVNAVACSKGIVFLRSDKERKAALGIDETSVIPASDYTHEASCKNYQLLKIKAMAALISGYSVVVDAVFLDSENRDALLDIANSLNIPFYGYWLEAPEQILRNRLNSRTGDASDANAEIMQGQLKNLSIPAKWLKIDAGDSKNHTLSQILTHLPNVTLPQG